MLFVLVAFNNESTIWPTWPLLFVIGPIKKETAVNRHPTDINVVICFQAVLNFFLDALLIEMDTLG